MGGGLGEEGGGEDVCVRRCPVGGGLGEEGGGEDVGVQWGEVWERREGVRMCV